VSWTEALRTIVKNCYKHHGREDLLHVFSDETSLSSAPQTMHFSGTVVQTINNPDGTVSVIHIDTGAHGGASNIVTLPDGTQAQVVHAVTGNTVSASHIVFLFYRGLAVSASLHQFLFMAVL
jgi:nuclear respiratory factor 1